MIILGDIHGGFQYLIELLVMFDFQNESIISVGDFGLGFDTLSSECMHLAMLNNSLRRRNIKLYVIRGNHDNPSYWRDSNDSKDPGFSNIILVRDYTVMIIENKNVLFIGGAISIDRSVRTEGRNYWKDEVIIRNDEFIKSLPENSIDIVITHSPLTSLFRHVLSTDLVNEYVLRGDKNLWRDIDKEQSILEDYNNILKVTQKDSLKMWFSGHLHISSVVNTDNIKYIVLNIDEFYEVRNESQA